MEPLLRQSRAAGEARAQMRRGSLKSRGSSVGSLKRGGGSAKSNGSSSGDATLAAELAALRETVTAQAAQIVDLKAQLAARLVESGKKSNSLKKASSSSATK
eukprot:TRINITY_DN2917_c0_g2_i1.p4 TRINITY_DN2917_c0_g2~~TRINITY_DN2917_c0_g2_i1.p4  ORF type:complete len:102 (+),score=77.98 TRINITY_DN2917_c0_g2_i1:52-357(+)